MVYHQGSLKLSYWFGLIALLCSCSDTQQPSGTENELLSADSLPPLFQQMLEAHGGLEKWKQMQLLEFDLYSDTTWVDHQIVDLGSRKVLIRNDEYAIGYDGNNVWYTGEEKNLSGESARFYHNLQFYFFALPFVLADPGVVYEQLEARSFQGKTYDVMRFTYESEVGDSPKDEYIIYINPETHQMELLLYTVTYFSGVESDDYGARLYSEWQWVNGLLVPLTSERYSWAGDSLGELRYASSYRKVNMEERSPDQAMFLQPNDALVSD
ncbi:DUF6503 family protein [Catalinimonas niigatensis]|uniref:DUF6503 family protein n=1 Tax=Catalinimonas niigatensis TaxID=1397264 RepID=UPI0026667B80|nr:DUF6503 family protein [Catalinimonas niigatensis]WPP50645.1 DUF6503 family protein [Catalinimonas niigatensis]